MTRLRTWAVAVVIPARDEADTIAATITSVRVALDQARRRCSETAIVVVADHCTDATVERAHYALAGHGTVLVSHAGRVGSARALGATFALGRLDRPPAQAWIANTDADTTVDPDWLERQLDHADTGIELVAGIVSVGPHPVPRHTRFTHAYQRLIGRYTHAHIHAANLGIRADLLARVGNWADLSTGEDHDLFRRARVSGARCHQDPNLIVTTSARLTGRAPDGFAGDLARFSA